MAAFDEPICWIAIYISKFASNVKKRERIMNSRLRLSVWKICLISKERISMIGNRTRAVKKELINSNSMTESFVSIF